MSNIFENYEFMKGASEQDFFDAAVEKANELINACNELEGLERSGIIGLLSCAINIGVMDDGEISEQEECMIKYVVERTFPDAVDDVMTQAKGPVVLTLLKLQQLKQFGVPVLFAALLNTALCFAYVDGKFEEGTSQMLSDIVGAAVM